MIDSREISCVTKKDGRITHVGGIYGFARFKMSIQAARNAIESKTISFYVIRDGNPVRVDLTDAEPLLKLPDCP